VQKQTKNKIENPDPPFKLAQHVIDMTSEAVLVVDKKAQIHHANERACIMLGYNSRELLSKKIFEISNDYRPSEWVSFWKMAKKSKSSALSCNFNSKEGQILREEANANFLKIDGRDYVCIFLKAESEENYEDGSLSSRERLDNVINSISDLILVKDSKHRWMIINDAIVKALGTPREELMGKSDHDFFPKHQADVFWANDDRVLKSGKEHVNEEEFTDSRGNTMILLTKKTLFRDLKGDKFIVGISRDITERKLMEQKLKYSLDEVRGLSLQDDLTRLYNRRGFISLANQQIRLADRKRTNLLLLFVDLDNMKKINDELGHEQGDQALMDVAQILRQSFRRSDIISRIGGDEFVVLAIDTDMKHAGVITTKLQNNIDNHNKSTEAPYKISLSLGMSAYDFKSPCTIEHMLKTADSMMYENKRGKKLA
jgi:diguanylate cyclase (GGDEF)-like protein/PAS domain S-box-containing protein